MTALAEASGVLVVSLAVRVTGAVYATALYVRVRDTRYLFLTAMVALMALRQYLALEGAPIGTEVPGLLVSVLAVGIVAYIDRHRRRDEALTAELRASNEQLAANRERLSATLAASPEFIFVFDADGHYRAILSGAEDITIRDRSSFVGSHVRAIMPAPTADAVERAIAETVATGEGQRFQYELPRDGRTRWYEGQTAPFRAPGTDDQRVLLSARDITERKERERQVRVLDRVLRHNVNNDMNVVRGYAELVAERATGAVADAGKRIVTASDRLLDVVDKERQITQVLLREPQRVRVPIGSHLDTVVEEIRETFSEATVEANVDPDLVVRAIPELRLAVDELLDNAIRHADLPAPTVAVEAHRVDGDVVVRVADSGPGIPSEELTILSGERDIEPLYHGSGLGLWLVYWIVSRSEGRLEFAANDPRGSVVTVTLEDVGE